MATSSSTSSLSSPLLLLLALCLGLAGAQDASTHEGCVHLPVIHSTNANYFSKRAVEVQLANRSDIAYFAELNIGTPPQSVFVQLDTGSFELWVDPDCSSLSGSDDKFCQGVGQYEPTLSSTAQALRTSRTLEYGIGAANVSYFTDSITLSGQTPLTAVQFGVATSSSQEFSGILGIGYGQGIATSYKNFVDQLAAQNATKVKAFSLALGSKDAQEGVVVFGGVDTSKFAGALAKLPIIPADQSPDGVPRYWVNMDGVSLVPPSGRTAAYPNSSFPVFLDSGSTMSLLPTALANAIAADFGAGPVDSNGFYEVDCSLTGVNGTLNFAFGSTTVQVSYAELIRTQTGSPPTCFLGVSPSSSFTLLGDTFLRSAYAVFDLEDNNVWMAQAAECGSTPAALSDVQVLATLTGTCDTTNSEVVSGSVSSSPPSVGAGSGQPTSSSPIGAPPSPTSPTSGPAGATTPTTPAGGAASTGTMVGSSWARVVGVALVTLVAVGIGGLV